MTLLFVDGFDHYATADLSKKYNALESLPIISAGNGRRGGAGMRVGSNTGVTKIIPATSSFVIGVAVRLQNLPSAQITLIQLTDAGSNQCALRLNPDGTLSVVRATSAAVTSGTSVLALATGAENYIEWKVTIADSISAGSCKVRVNSVEVLTVATGQDLKATANTTANGVTLKGVASNTDFDDFYICDQSGSTNNDFLGDVRIDTLFPNEAGYSTQFTPSTGSTNWQLVDETTPNTTDHNDGDTVGHRDSYGMSNLAALTSQVVYGVQVNMAVLKDDAGAKSAATFVRSGTTNADGASAALGTSQTYVSQVFEQDPAAAAAWTETTVNAMEAGVVVTA